MRITALMPAVGSKYPERGIRKGRCHLAIRPEGGRRMSMYPRFAAMIATSTVAMYGLMFLNTYSLDHLAFSETRTYMALVMGATMAVIMLAFMTKMLTNRLANISIVIAGVLVFALCLWLVRSQATIDDVSYMKAMIPHHSIAILTSERAHITDPRVRELANVIIESQREEILEMKKLITDLEQRDPAQ
jgi:hypothetical protein